MPEDEPKAGARRLEGRHILVTGAASGIGRAIAELFHNEGAALALVDRDQAGIEAVSAQLHATAVTLDLSSTAAIGPAIESAIAQLGALDGVVNCAAFAAATAIAQTDLALLEKFVSVNLVAPFLICRAALPHLRRVPGATIVNIASGQALLPNTPNNTAYAATKGGLVAFSKSLAAEAAPDVRVNVVCPGVTNTPMAAPLFVGYDNPSDAPWVKQYALRRVAEPIEIAEAVLFLTSKASSYVTGTALAVDGGRSFH